MSLVVFDLCLYTADQYDDWSLCPWRQYLNSLPNIQYKDLNYFSTNLEDVVFPLNSWLSPEEEKFTVDSFPFVLYQKIDTTNTTYSNLIIHRTLESLQNDDLIKTFNT